MAGTCGRADVAQDASCSWWREANVSLIVLVPETEMSEFETRVAPHYCRRKTSDTWREGLSNMQLLCRSKKWHEPVAEQVEQ